MKIQIRDFGPIHKFDFDLSKDLTVIYGENNIGKSYALSLIYLIIKNFYFKKFESLINLISYYFETGDIEIKKKVLKDFIQLEKKLNEQKSINIKPSLLSNIFQNVMDELYLENLSESLINTFGNINELTNKSSDKFAFTIGLDFKEIYFEIRNEKYNLEINKIAFNKEFILKASTKKRKYLNSKNKITFYSHKEKPIIESVKEYISDIFNEILNEIFSEVHSFNFLPASRSGLYQALNSLSPIISELSKKRSSIQEQFSLPSISEPINDYFLELSEIDSSYKGFGRNFEDILFWMELSLLGGEIHFDDGKKKLVYSQNIGDKFYEFDLSNTSSMVSEISPIIAYLRYIIPKKEAELRRMNAKATIFIEEPEAHLHPEIQIKLSDFFVQLVNSGCKIIIISHSNYIFNKLNNLVLEGKLDTNKYAPYILEQTEKGSVAKLMEIDELGVEDENFTATNEKLYYEQLKIIDKLNNDKND